MRPIRNQLLRFPLRIITLAGLTAGLSVVVACGGEESTPAPAAEGGDAAKIEIPEGEAVPDAPVQIETGQMPEGYPADLPTYPGAEPTSSMLAGGTGLLVLSSKEPADAVFAFYEKELPAQGWSVDEAAADMMRIQTSKGKQSATIKIGSAADHTEIAIVLSGS